MANHKLVTVASVRGKEQFAHPVKAAGVRLDNSDGRGAWKYVGSEEALVSAGLARNEWLPGTPACPQSTAFTIMVGQRRTRIEKRPKGEFSVLVDRTDDERTAERRHNELEKVAPGLGCPSITPDVATRLLACWGLLARAAVDIGVRCEGSTKLQRALDDVVQVRDVIGGIAGALADMRLDPAEAEAPRLHNDRAIRELVLQIGQGGRKWWDYGRSHTRTKLKAQPGTPKPVPFGGEDSESGHKHDDDDDEDWPST